MKLIINIIINISLYTGFSIMVAGSGAIFEEHLGLSFNLGIMVMILFSFIIFLFNIEGLSFINSILIPMLIVGIVFISFYMITGETHNLLDIQGLKLTKKKEIL